MLPFPSLVLAFLIGPDGEICWILLIQTGGATLTVSTAAATAAATAVAEVPLKGLFALNSLHFAPSTVIIFDMGILGFFLAMSGLTTKKKFLDTEDFTLRKGCSQELLLRNRKYILKKCLSNHILCWLQ